MALRFTLLDTRLHQRDFDVAVDKGPAKVTKSSQNGLTKISTDDWTYGKVNGGGAEVMVKTMNGSIYLRKAK